MRRFDLKKKSASTAVPTHPASVVIVRAAPSSSFRAAGGGRWAEMGTTGLFRAPRHTGRSCLVRQRKGADRLLLCTWSGTRTCRCRRSSLTSWRATDAGHEVIDADLEPLMTVGEHCAWTTGYEAFRGCHGGERGLRTAGWRLSMGPRVPWLF